MVKNLNSDKIFEISVCKNAVVRMVRQVFKDGNIGNFSEFKYTFRRLSLLPVLSDSLPHLIQET